MSPSQVEHWIVKLRQRVDAADLNVSALTQRVVELEAFLLSVPPDRLLGRYATTTGPVQFIRIGTGLDLVDDQLVNTGGGGSSAVASFTLQCIDDLTDHLVQCVLVDGRYNLRVDQSPGGSSAVTGKTLIADDATNHVLRLRLLDGYYTLQIVQSAGGSDPVASIRMLCATDSTEQTLTCVLQDGYYTWTFD